jgi:hypothetical protein
VGAASLAGSRILRSRDGRLLLAAQRLEAERDAVIAGNQAYEQYRAADVTRRAGGLAGHRTRGSRPICPRGVVSVSDPDSQRMQANLGYVQGYNAQAVVDESQIVLAAEITTNPAISRSWAR